MASYKTGLPRSHKGAPEAAVALRSASTYKEIRELAQAIWSFPVGSEEREQVYMEAFAATSRLNGKDWGKFTIATDDSPTGRGSSDWM